MFLFGIKFHLKISTQSLLITSDHFFIVTKTYHSVSLLLCSLEVVTCCIFSHPFAHYSFHPLDLLLWCQRPAQHVEVLEIFSDWLLMITVTV